MISVGLRREEVVLLGYFDKTVNVFVIFKEEVFIGCELLDTLEEHKKKWPILPRGSGKLPRIRIRLSCVFDHIQCLSGSRSEKGSKATGKAVRWADTQGCKPWIS